MSGSAAAPKTGGTPDGVDVVQSCRTFTPGEVERQESEFRKGDVVCITQLKKNPQLNWRLGVVVKPSDTYEGRVGVRLLCQGENDYMLHGLKPVNIFTVPRDVTPTMITNLIAFGVPVSDGKLLVKHFDFKYTPAPPSSLPSSPAPRRASPPPKRPPEMPTPEEDAALRSASTEDLVAAPEAAPEAERVAENSSAYEYPDGSVRSFSYTPDMTPLELLEKCFRETALQAAAFTAEAAPTPAPLQVVGAPPQRDR